ncbi:MAG: aminotransferase class V-fold PLP-dependent enzyme [Armatimonadota bacterium]
MPTLAAQYADQFPVKRDHVYLNHAGVCPLPICAVEAANAVLQQQLLHGASDYTPWAVGISAARRDVAALCGASKAEIAFVKNTTHGLLLAAGSLPWREGDNLVTAAIEFPANIHPWLGLKRLGVQTRLVDAREGRILIDDLAAAMDSHTRALALSWVQFSSGYRSDLAALSELCRERGAYLIVDGIQGLGALQLDLGALGVDFLCADGHKWLLSVEGCAALYVNQRVIGALNSANVGWMGMENCFDFLDYRFRPRPDARRFEEGSPSVVGIHALGASVAMLLQAGPAQIEREIIALTDTLADRLQGLGCRITSPRGAGEKSGLLTFTHPKVASADLAAALNARQIVCVERAGNVRFSPHFYNDAEEIERAVEAVKQIAAAP